MMDNFAMALTKFEADVKSGKANVQVVRKDGGPGGGGGAMDATLLLALAGLLSGRLILARR